MRARSSVERTALVGYAIGVGLVFVATLGVYWRYWQPGTSVVVWAGGSFALGAAAAAAVATVRRLRGGAGNDEERRGGAP